MFGEPCILSRPLAPLARTLYGSAAPSNRMSFVEGSDFCYRRRAVRGRPGLSNRSTDLLRHQIIPLSKSFTIESDCRELYMSASSIYKY